MPPIGAVRTEKTQLFSGLRWGNTKSLLGLPLSLIRVRVPVGGDLVAQVRQLGALRRLAERATEAGQAAPGHEGLHRGAAAPDEFPGGDGRYAPHDRPLATWGWDGQG